MLLKDKLAGRRLILASQSPRRRELIAGYGIDFTIADNYDVEEVFPDDLTATEVPQYLADLKSKAYPHELSPEDILITADTVVLLGERIMGKPKIYEEAWQRLGVMPGTRDRVGTGGTVGGASN